MRETLTTRELAIFSPSASPRRDTAGWRKAQDFFIRILDALGEWQDRAAQRHHLAAFDNRMLRDIGIDRATAAAEVAKPFWRS